MGAADQGADRHHLEAAADYVRHLGEAGLRYPPPEGQSRVEQTLAERSEEELLR